MENKSKKKFDFVTLIFNLINNLVFKNILKAQKKLQKKYLSLPVISYQYYGCREDI